MVKRKEAKENTPKFDTLTAIKGNEKIEAPLPPQSNQGAVGKSEIIKIEFTDNKVPSRGIFWYIIFTLVSLGSTALIIYLKDWALLFFAVVFAGATLWRGNMSTKISIGINDQGIKINDKEFIFNQIESWYFSRIGNDFTITFQMVKKYLPSVTYIFEDQKYLEQIRKALGDKVPETEPREESILDFLIRMLKI